MLLCSIDGSFATQIDLTSQWEDRSAGHEIMNLFSKLREWRLYGETVEKLRQCTDRNLADMGISRAEIRAVAKRSVRALR